MAIWDGQVTVALMRYATSACKGTILTTRGMIAAKMPRQKKSDVSVQTGSMALVRPYAVASLGRLPSAAVILLTPCKTRCDVRLLY
jgi:hypothetical protein